MSEETPAYRTKELKDLMVDKIVELYSVITEWERDGADTEDMHKIEIIDAEMRKLIEEYLNES